MKHSDELSTKANEPSSCEELATNGHSSDGLYLVKNPDSKKIEAVACSFGANGEFIAYGLISSNECSKTLFFILL